MTNQTQRGFIFLYVPWWVNLVLAGMIYGTLQYLLPLLGRDSPIIASIARGLQPLTPYLVLLFLVLAGLGILFELRRTRHLEAQEITAANARSIPWEMLISRLASAFAQRDFKVEMCDQRRGVDMILHASDGSRVVSCRYWQAEMLDTPFVRELLGVMTAEGAVAGILVTGGGFTQAAASFADEHSIFLVDGPQLAAMMGG